MHLGLSEFLEEQKKGLVEMAENLRKSRVAAARKAAIESAARIKSLNARVRALARSGVRLTSISRDAVQNLIGLQSDIITAALTDAAAQLERAAYTENVRDLARIQAEVLQGTRQRLVDDITRAVTILKDAAGDVRKVAGRSPPEEAKPAVRRRGKAPAKRKARKVARRARRAPA